jgi:hypothetical protein
MKRKTAEGWVGEEFKWEVIGFEKAKVDSVIKKSKGKC